MTHISKNGRILHVANALTFLYLCNKADDSGELKNETQCCVILNFECDFTAFVRHCSLAQRDESE
jgi:hypothetical protein